MFELINVLNRSVSESVSHQLEHGGRLIESIGHDALEYCWSEMKRLGRGLPDTENGMKC